MLEIFRCAITDDEMYALCRVLFDRASTGDMAALKMIFQYKMGKPQPAPNPDLLDRNEWDNLQKDGMTNEEMKQALTRLPSRVGNRIVSAALPEIIETFTRDLAGKLVNSLPADLRAQVEASHPATGPNGFSPAQPAPNSLATDHLPLTTTPPAQPTNDSTSPHAPRSTPHAPPIQPLATTPPAQPARNLPTTGHLPRAAHSGPNGKLKKRKAVSKKKRRVRGWRKEVSGRIGA
jgi:hypothetical protein